MSHRRILILTKIFVYKPLPDNISGPFMTDSRTQYTVLTTRTSINLKVTIKQKENCLIENLKHTK